MTRIREEEEWFVYLFNASLSLLLCRFHAVLAITGYGNNELHFVCNQSQTPFVNHLKCAL